MRIAATPAGFDRTGQVDVVEPATVSAIAVLVTCMAVVALATQHQPVAPVARNAPGIGLPTRNSSGAGRRTALGANEKIDLSSANVREIERLPGVGPRLAQRIADRRAVGLASIEDLDAVSGVGPKLLEKIAPHVSFGANSSANQRSNPNPSRNENASITGPSDVVRSSGRNVARSSNP